MGGGNLDVGEFFGDRFCASSPLGEHHQLLDAASSRSLSRIVNFGEALERRYMSSLDVARRGPTPRIESSPKSSLGAYRAGKN